MVYYMLFMAVYCSFPFTLDLNGTVSIGCFLKNTQVDTQPHMLCLLSSHQTLSFKKEVTGAELHTQGFVLAPPVPTFGEHRRGVA